MADLRIFSYLPNPRLYKATVAARYCGVDIELRSAAPRDGYAASRIDESILEG